MRCYEFIFALERDSVVVLKIFRATKMFFQPFRGHHSDIICALSMYYGAIESDWRYQISTLRKSDCNASDSSLEQNASVILYFFQGAYRSAFTCSESQSRKQMQ